MINSDPVQLFPNSLGFFILLIIPLQVLYLFNQASSQKITARSIYLFISSVVIFTAFFLIFSRATFIALFLIAIIFIYIQLSAAHKKKPYFKSKSIRSLLLVFICSFLLLSSVNLARSNNYDISTTENYLNLNASENTMSFFDRFNYMKGAFHLNLEYPIFGIGNSNFRFFYPKYQEVAFNSEHPYSFMMRLSSELGTPGALIQTLFFVFLIYYFIKHSRKVEQKYYLGALAFAMFGSSIQAMMNFTINNVLNASILPLFVAIFISRFPITKNKIQKGWVMFTSIFLTGIVITLLIIPIHELNTRKWNDLAQNNFEQKDYIGAANAYETAAEESWFKEDFQVKSSEMYQLASEESKLSEKQIDDWLLKAEKSTQTNPHYSESWNNYGDALFASGELESSIKMYEKALELDSHNYLEYYLDLIKAKHKNRSLSQVDIDLVKGNLEDYTNLLQENPYVLENSPNNAQAQSLYEYLLKEIVPEDEELNSEYQEFLVI
ncbi:O-antigen ligase family protein [Patescibacteria group bacterium]